MLVGQISLNGTQKVATTSNACIQPAIIFNVHRLLSSLTLTIDNGLGSEIVLDETVQRSNENIFNQIPRNQVQRFLLEMMGVNVVVDALVERSFDRIFMIVIAWLKIRRHIVIGRSKLQWTWLHQVVVGAEMYTGRGRVRWETEFISELMRCAVVASVIEAHWPLTVNMLLIRRCVVDQLLIKSLIGDEVQGAGTNSVEFGQSCAALVKHQAFLIDWLTCR